jgi:flagellar biosynthetic protein FliQ
VSETLVVELARRAITLAMLLCAPMVLTSLIIGLLVSIFQSVTSIQEQTLTFVPKLIAVSVVFLIALPWMMQLTTKYTADLFRSLPTLFS